MSNPLKITIEGCIELDDDDAAAISAMVWERIQPVLDDKLAELAQSLARRIERYVDVRSPIEISDPGSTAPPIRTGFISTEETDEIVRKPATDR